MVELYDGRCGDCYIQEWCNYVDISLAEFWRVTDKYVNKKLFEKDTYTARWKSKFRVGEDFDEE